MRPIITQMRFQRILKIKFTIHVRNAQRIAGIEGKFRPFIEPIALLKLGNTVLRAPQRPLAASQVIPLVAALTIVATIDGSDVTALKTVDKRPIRVGKIPLRDVIFEIVKPPVPTKESKLAGVGGRHCRACKPVIVDAILVRQGHIHLGRGTGLVVAITTSLLKPMVKTIRQIMIAHFIL